MLAQSILVAAGRWEQEAARPLELGPRGLDHLGDPPHGEPVEEHGVEADVEDVELLRVLRLHRGGLVTENAVEPVERGLLDMRRDRLDRGDLEGAANERRL